MSERDPGFERRYQDALARARDLSKSLEGPSLFERLARLPKPARDKVIAQFSTLDLARLAFEWSAWARPKQDPDLSRVAHRILFVLAGRGFGKSLTGAQRVRRRVEAGARSIGIIGPTLDEVEKYMLGGEGGADGLLSVFHPSQKPEWKAHKRKVVFHTGAIGYVNTAEKPEFRGPNLDTVWGDEPGKWRYLRTIWPNIELSTRLPGALPLELIITGTPIPIREFKEWVADEDTVTVVGSMFENASNLDGKYVASMQRKLGGTRLGRQELEGEILSDNPDALFLASVLDATRVQDAPEDLRVVVAVDPAIATGRDNDETGIVVIGIDEEGHLYVLADASVKAKPERWGQLVVEAYEQWGAVAIVGERNRGGDLVAANVRAALERKRGGVAAKALKIVEVQATKGKVIRAEPVSALHEKGFVHIVGVSPELEAELTEWNPRIGGASPNRLDALVWGIWYLARLGEDIEPPKDYRAALRGASKAAAELRAPQRAKGAGASGLAAALPRSSWGSRL